MAYTVLSFDFHVRTLIPGVERRISELFAPFRREEGTAEHEFFLAQADERQGFEVALDGVIAHRARRLGTAIDWVLWKASSEAIAGIRDHLAIHAGAVAWRDAGVLLPAPPDSGKTTLTAGLVAAGFSYFSDEAALLDPASGLLVPFPRALWLENGSVAALDRFLSRADGEGFSPNDIAHVAAEHLRNGWVGDPCPVRFVVFPHYAAGSDTRLAPITRAESLLELGRNAFNLEAFGAEGVGLLGELARGAESYRLSIGELAPAVEAVSNLVGAPVRG